MEPGPSQSQGNIWPALVGQVHRLWGCIFLAAVICPLAGKAGLKAREGSLVNKTGVRPVPGQGLACWWVDCNCRLPTCGFLVAGVCPLVGKARPKARAGSFEGGARAQGILGLEPAHWWVGSCILGFLAGELWGPRSSAYALMCGVRSCILWWAGMCPGFAVCSGGLKAACLLMGEAMSMPS